MKSSAMIEQIKANSRAYENKLRSIEKELSAAHDSELRIQHNLALSLKRFAAVQLEENTDATQELQRTLEERSEAEHQLRIKLASAEASVVQQNDFRLTITANLEKVVETVEQQLAANEPYQSLYAQAHLAVSTSAATQNAFLEIDKECSTKLEAYGADRLYAYLRSISYGTPAYRSGKLARFLDAWIAGLCNFNQNYSSEQTLLAMQEASSATNQAALGESARLKYGLDAFRKLARRSAGAEALEEKLAAVEAERGAAKERALRIQYELYPFVERRDPHYLAAHSTLTDYLGSVSLDSLKELADETLDLKDDQELEVIADLRTQLKKAGARTQSIACIRDEATLDHELAKALERELRISRYTSSDYRYSSDLDLNSLLVGYMAGSISSSQVVSQVESNRLSVPSLPTYSSSTSSSSSSNWGGGSGGGGFGGFSSSRSDSGGGFSTSDSL